MKYSKVRKLVSLLVILMLVSCTSAASTIKQSDPSVNGHKKTQRQSKDFPDKALSSLKMVKRLLQMYIVGHISF